MAKALTMPSAPEAPIAPQISIGDRIHGIEDRIEEIEGISGMTGVSKSRKSQQTQQEEAEDTQEEQEEVAQTSQAQQSKQTQSTPQTQQRQPSSRNVTTPETMARDAVANGAGALTKRTTQRKSDDKESEGTDSGTSQPRNQTTVVIPPSSALNDNGQTDFERGRAVLNEFKRLDQEEAAKQSSLGSTTSSETSSGLFAPSYGSNSHGAAYWLFTLVAVAVLAFVFVRQFLVNKDSKSGTPPLTKSMLDIPDISQPPSAVRQSALNQYRQSKPASSAPSPKPKPSPTIKPPIVKPVTLKNKSSAKTEDDNKGSHFEVRV